MAAIPAGGANAGGSFNIPVFTSNGDVYGAYSSAYPPATQETWGGVKARHRQSAGTASRDKERAVGGRRNREPCGF